MKWLLTWLLKPLMKQVLTHLERSEQLIYIIRGATPETLQECNYGFSLDVQMMCTRVAPNEAIESVAQRIKIGHKNRLAAKFKVRDIKAMLELCTDNVYFIFRSNEFLNRLNTYKQVSGLPKGLRRSGILATLILDDIENRVLRTDVSITVYTRYVDDTFILTKSMKEAVKICEVLNDLHENIKLEVEHPDTNRTLNLLDFSVTFNGGRAEIQFFERKTKKDTFLHADSAYP
ncbi:hypothetical protein Ahia01_000056000 [Argonauta hians]